MTFYIACRPLIFRKDIISPKDFLKYNFSGLNFTFNCLGYNRSIDGRWLYQINISDSYDEKEKDEIKEVIISGLAAFAAKEKKGESLEKIKEKLLK